MISRRDIAVVLLSVCVTSIAFSVTNSTPQILGASVYDWHEMKASKTDVGEYRQVIRQPTATLDELELHVTTLNPGLSSHLPHQHVNEELVIIRDGTVEVLSNGEWKKIGPGAVVFNSTNSPHALRNIGNTPAVYHVINWRSAETKRLEEQLSSSTGVNP
jgi:XRE family transcriptional regulator, regulator of sulfur utilization